MYLVESPSMKAVLFCWVDALTCLAVKKELPFLSLDLRCSHAPPCSNAASLATSVPALPWARPTPRATGEAFSELAIADPTKAKVDKVAQLVLQLVHEKAVQEDAPKVALAIRAAACANEFCSGVAFGTSLFGRFSI